MDSFIFKVIFRAQEQLETKNLTLSFKGLTFKKPLPIPERSLLELKNLTEKNQEIINFQNIEEVLIIGTPTIDYTYNYFLVLLFSKKTDQKKTGYLIGNIKKFGDIIIGVWPFNTQDNDLFGQTSLDTFDDILKNPNKYENICLISQ